MINLSIPTIHLIVFVISILLMLLAAQYGDSSKSTAWMFFLGPLGLLILCIYWAYVWFNPWIVSVVLLITIVSMIWKIKREL